MNFTLSSLNSANISSFFQTYSWDLFLVLITIAVLLTFGKVVMFFLKKYANKIADRTTSKLDDLILNAVDGIIEIAMFFIGLRIGLSFTQFVSMYPSILNTVFYLIWVALGGILIIKISNVFFDFNRKRLGVGPSTFFKKITKFVVGVLVFIMALNHFQIEISPIIASLGIAGLAVALALQDTLSNFFTGIYITADQPIRPGDYIEVDKVAGHVIDIGWRSTRVKTWDNNVFVIPNKKLGESIILNYNLENPIISTSVTVEAPYSVNPSKVEKILKKVSLKVKNGMEETVKDYEPVAKINAFKASGIEYLVIIRVKDRNDKFTVRPELRRQIYKAFKRNKIDIPYTTYDVNLKK